MRGKLHEGRKTKDTAGRGRLRLVAVAVSMLGGTGGAAALSIDTGNDDFTMRLDTKISATAAMRVRGRDDGIAANPALSSDVSSDYFAGKSDVYSTRFDLYSEYDVTYQGTTGLRLSGAAWYDPSFLAHPRNGPGGAGNSSFGPNNQWPGEIKRYYGRGAEMLDSFLFTRVDLGNVPVSIKAGRTSIVWGESLFGGVGGSNSIGYAQAPNDGRKSSQNPNSSLKETSLPTAQLSMVFNVSENANLSIFRSFEWRPDRVPGSGTYMGFGDGIAGAPYLFCAAGGAFCYPYGGEVRGKVGDWGVQYKTRPSFFDGNVSVTYREFAEKAPWYAAWDVSGDAPAGGDARSLYGNKTKLAGVTWNTTKWDVSWAGEFSYRKNAALVSDFSALAPVAVGGANGSEGFSVSPTQGARGDTMHALVNAQVVYGKSLFWDTFTVAAEAAVSHLNKVTTNESLFQASGSAYAPVVCNSGSEASKVVAGCVDRTAESLGVFLDPTIYQVMPSVDMEIPIFLQANWHNSPLNGGSTTGFNTLSAGLKGTWNTSSGPQVFQLTYLAFTNRTSTGNTNGHAILGAPYYDRSQVQFSYTSSF